jgi:uncharacterized phage protein gp47/JayE
MAYGVTPEGFNKKTLEDIKEEIEASLRAALGDGINLLSTSVFGKIVGIIADRESEIWDVAAAVYASQYPQSASDQSLDNVSAITGVTRLEATSTVVNVQCAGTPTTLIATGKVVSNDAGVRFALSADATIAAAAAWAGTTAYSVDDIVTNDSNIYVCTVAGTSAGAGGPTGTADGIVDGTVTWNFVGDGTGNVLGAFAAEETGPLTCATGAIDTEDGKGAIETPVAGWNDARNLEDGDVGRDLEKDAELRLRREQLLASTGNASLDAIIAKTAEVDGVTESIAFENSTDATDADGLPPHSFEEIARGGDDQDIFDKLWKTKAAGIQTFGGESGVALDIIGNPHVISFSRPTEKPVHVIVDVTVDPLTYPADGDAQVKAAIKAFGDAQNIGDDVITSQLYEPVFSVSGVVDVTKLWVSFTDPPTGPANLTVAKDELATWDTGNIDVTST